MEEKCACEPTEILLFTCSGASNVGQIANLAALKLTQDGVGRMFCLAGIGGHISKMIESTKAGKIIVEIDGCPVTCAKKVLEHAGFKPQEYVQVTKMRVEKNHGFDYPQSKVDKVAAHLKDRISQRRAV